MRVDILEEMQPRRRQRNGRRAGELTEALAAEARSAGAEDQDVVEFTPIALGDGAERSQIVLPRRQAQQRQAAVRVAAAETVDRRPRRVEQRSDIGARESVGADGVREAIFNVLAIGHVQPVRDFARRPSRMQPDAVKGWKNGPLF